MRARAFAAAFAGAAGLVVVCGQAVVAQRSAAQRGIAAGEWLEYGGDASGMKYSPLNQITSENVKQLKIAWRWPAGKLGQAADPSVRASRYDATPLAANGMLYTLTPLGVVAALEPASGQPTWTYETGSYTAGRHAAPGYAMRSMSYWTDGTRERLFVPTNDASLISIDVKTGKPDPAFGSAGRVDVAEGVSGATRAVTFAAAGSVAARDVVLVGSSVHGSAGVSAPRGVVRAYDARTGALRWTTSTDAPGVSAAVGMTFDAELGYVFVPTSTASAPDGPAAGAGGLMADSLTALDVKTGKRVWHFQAVHRNIWGYDLPTHPTLGDVTVGGRRIKAVMLISEQHFVYAFDRKTGQPLWPIVETPVPQATGAVRTAATQPIPSKPPAFDLQGAEIDGLIDYTPEVNEQAMERFQKLQTGPLYTPPAAQGTLTIPDPSGGTGAGGAAFDPETGLFYVPSRTTFAIRGGEDGAHVSDLLYVSDLPIVRRPYARVTAIDMNKGERYWMFALGNGPASFLVGGTHPVLSKLGGGPPLPPLGDPILGAAPLVTKGLLFVAVTNLTPAGEPQPAPWSKWVHPDGIRKVLYVFDKRDGRPVHVVSLDSPAASAAAPMTFLHQGKQYLVIASGAGEQAELIALALK